MNRTTILLLVLLAVMAVVGIIAFQDPEHARRIDDARRQIAFTGEARETAMIAFFLAVGGFVVYLLMTRR